MHLRITGAFFSRHGHDDVLDAIKRCDAIDTAPAEIAGSARRFSQDAFRSALLEVLQTRMRSSRERTDMPARSDRRRARSISATLT